MFRLEEIFTSFVEEPFVFVDIWRFIYFFCYNILIYVRRLIEDMNFFHDVFKTLGFVCSFVTLTLILLTWRIWWARNNASRWQMEFNSAFKVFKFVFLSHGFLLLGLLRNVWSTLLLGFVLLGFMVFLLVGLQFILRRILVFVIVQNSLGRWGSFVFPGSLVCLLVWWKGLQLTCLRRLLVVYLGLI